MSKNNENKLVPVLRFPEFKNFGAWEVDEVGNVFEVTRGYVLSMNLVSEEQSESNPFPVYSSQTKNKGLAGYYSDFLYEDAITWTTDGANAGDVNFRNGKFFCTNVCGVLLNKNGFANLCIASLINSVSRKHVSYIGNPKLMNGVMSKIKIPFPKIIEQQKISDFLSSLDAIIKAESQKLDLLYKYKKGLLQNLFPKEGETVPEFRFKEFTKSWKKVKLRDVSLYFNGGSFENDVKEEGKYELITLKSINTNGQLVSSKRFIDIEVPTLVKDTLVMILSEQAPGLLGMTAIIPTANKYVLNQRVAEIRPSKEVKSYFLSMAINRNQTYFSKQGAGMKVQNISKPNVQNYEFLIPEIQEQKKIATCLSSLDEIISAQNQKLDSLKFHKKGLLQGLFPPVNNEA
jgi:type I restriction enzyme, S subunit